MCIELYLPSAASLLRITLFLVDTPMWSSGHVQVVLQAAYCLQLCATLPRGRMVTLEKAIGRED